MHILHLNSSLDPAAGGPSIVLARMAAEQRRRGLDVTIITADAPGKLGAVIGTLQELGITVHETGPATGPLAKAPHAMSTLRRVLGTQRPDVAHLHGMWLHLLHWGSAELRRHRTPYIWRPCGMLDPWSLGQGRLKKKLFWMARGARDVNGAAALHFTTATEQRLVGPLRLRPRGYVIANGLDWEEFDPPPEKGAFRAAQGFGAEPVVLFLSRLHHKKGLDLLLPAFAQGAPAEARLALAGPGESGYVAELRERANALGIGERTVFVGQLDGAARLQAMVDADVFVLPSYQENFGVVVAEAAGVGAPILISDQVNLCDALLAARAGRVTPCTVDAVAAGLREILADPSAARAMGDRAKAWAAASFPWTKVADQIDAMYQDVVGAQARAESPVLPQPRG
ncbi:MAG: glycosyltransferase [Phycisphaerales bacterium]|nr:glycosyltransferase [Phycisphaerales bacterium]